MSKYTKERVKNLIKGSLSWPLVKDMMSSPKDIDRFEKYLELLQEKVPWDEKILLPYAEHLYVVAKDGDRIIKCDCGYEFGDYRKNWKLNALIYIRDTEEKLMEIYPKFMSTNPDYEELREYFCPQCKTLLDVEAVPPFYPPIFDFLPDVDAFYMEWLKREPPHVK